MRAGCIAELSKRQAHVYTLRGSATSDVLVQCEKVLSPDERVRADRIRFQDLRESFIATRGALRYLLGGYLGLHPASICLVYSSTGKAGLAHHNDLRFNVSHSGSMSAFALTAGCDIGIDLEQLRPLPDIEKIAARFFCPEEAAEIASLPAGERERAFFTCWTRKEAFIKASGAGLSRPLNSFRITSQPGDAGNLILLDREDDGRGLWSAHDLALATDYAAAIAYRDHPRALSIFPIADLAELIDRS
jgi:4'-phosphopantetheinyl transferase